MVIIALNLINLLARVGEEERNLGCREEGAKPAGETASESSCVCVSESVSAASVVKRIIREGILEEW